MKKFIFAITACLMMLAVTTSCGVDKSDPESVAEAACKCLKDKDYEGFMKFTTATESEQKMMVAMIDDKLEKSPDERDKVFPEEFEILNTTIDEENGTAKVKVKLTSKEGKVDEDDLKLVKAENGDWKIEFKMK